jgi:CSLREA domain-containing protein/uncharacterized repeat protein (TIGR01451 family)
MNKQPNNSSSGWVLRGTSGAVLAVSSAILLAFSFNLKAISFATLFVVTTTDDHNDFNCDSDCTLREAIQAANNTASDSVITFDIPTTDPGYSNGVWTINLANPLPPLNTSSGTSKLSISGPGADKLTVQNSNPQNNHAFRIFNVTTSGTASISGITIANGDVFSQTDYLGAGIQNYNAGTVNVTNCTLKNNDAHQWFDQLGHRGPPALGGGVANRAGGTININSSTLDDNSADYGGGIYNSGNGTVNVSNSTITHFNSATYGGAIYNDNKINLTNTTLDGNDANFGGGIYNDSGTVVITGCTLSNNSSYHSGGITFGAGGGIYNVNAAVVNVINSTLYDNGNDNGSATGGGIYNAGTLTVTNSTLTLNYIGGAGGGIFNDSTGTATIKSTIIADNDIVTGSTGSIVGGPDLYGSFISQGYNLISATDGNTGFNQPTDLTGSGTGSLDAGFEFDSISGPLLKDNGGPTDTVALVCGSTAIDQGTSSGLTGTLTTDQRGSGFPRVFDDPELTNAADGADIGAFELQQSCGGPTCNQVLFSENFDNVSAPALPSGWTTANPLNPDDPYQKWATSTATPESAPNDAFVADPANTSDAQLTSPVIHISTASAKLIFRNNYNLYYAGQPTSVSDGGVLEISINGGAFTDIIDAGGGFVSAGYNTFIEDNPVGCCNRSVWTGNSNGYVTTIVNLPPSVSGQNIQLRWRLGSVQNSPGGAGWRIDTVKILGCTAPTTTTTLTMQALPANEGTTDPAPGDHTVDLTSVVAVKAIPNSGYHFTQWTGNVAEPSNPSTSVTMSRAQTVTANFAAGAPSADLHVTVKDGKSAAIAGAQNTYTIVVGNAGSSYVSGAVVKDTFPSTFTGVKYSATAVGGAFGFTASGSGNINDTIALPPGSSITYKATGKLGAAATGTVSDKATVTVPTGFTDPNTANNSATDTDTITLKADLKVTVTDGKTSATAGSKNTYTIVVTNAGPSKVIGAVIHDSFPSIFTGVTYTASQSGGASGFTASGSGNISNTVIMPPASKITYKATGTVTASATGSISDTATVTAPSGVTDPNTANNSATDTDAL